MTKLKDIPFTNKYNIYKGQDTDIKLQYIYFGNNADKNYNLK